MRAVITATDFIKNSQGEFKAIENNTNVAISVWDISNYVNKPALDSFLSSNSITDITIALPFNANYATNTSSADGDTRFFDLQLFLRNNYENITTTSIGSDGNNQVPDWTDGPGKLLIRLCYDENAAIDETYAKDNFAFLKLMHDADSNSIPKTYFNDGAGLSLDSLGDTLHDNGDLPNYIIKLRYPTIDYAQYPKIRKVSSLADLEALKVGLQGNEILQEYIVNTDDLQEGKAKTYRKLDLIYGSNLDSLDLCQAYYLTNHAPLLGSVDYQGNGEVAGYERVRFIQRIGNIAKGVEIFNDSKIRMDNGTVKTGLTIEEGDLIDAAQLASESGSVGSALGRAAGLLSNSSYSSSELITKNTFYGNSIVVKIYTATDNFKVASGAKLLKTSIVNKIDPDGYDYTEEDIFWLEAKNLVVGDNLVITTSGTELNLIPVTAIEFYIEYGNAYTLDVEDIDHFFVASTVQDSNDSIVVHNKAEQCFCYEWEWFVDCDVTPCIGSSPCTMGYANAECSQTTPNCSGGVANQIIGDCTGFK